MICSTCKSEFTPTVAQIGALKSGRTIYCNPKCYSKVSLPTLDSKCIICKKPIKIWRYQLKENPTCSLQCSRLKRTSSGIKRWSCREARTAQSVKLEKIYSNPEIRSNVSNGLIKAIRSGKYTPKNHRGTHSHINTKKGGLIYCFSSWEADFAQYLDRDPEVLSFEKDKVRILYSLNDRIRIYIVDFLINYKSYGQVLVEIKPEYLLTTEENFAKLQEAKRWSFNNLIPFLVISDSDINLIRKSNTVPSIKQLGRLIGEIVR